MKDFILTYTIEDKLYLNVTNRCTNQCAFCIRKKGGVGYNLWLEREPQAGEVIASLGDLHAYSEIVFCGYGEPLVRLDLVVQVAGYIKREYGKTIRINTNGHADLIHGRGTVNRLAGLVDKINVSLNAQDGGTYMDICRPVFGRVTYEALLRFASGCIGVIPSVTLSVVQWPGVDVEKCREIAGNLGAGFRLREYSG